jgi:hypothetical protein
MNGKVSEISLAVDDKIGEWTPLKNLKHPTIYFIVCIFPPFFSFLLFRAHKVQVFLRKGTVAFHCGVTMYFFNGKQYQSYWCSVGSLII